MRKAIPEDFMDVGDSGALLERRYRVLQKLVVEMLNGRISLGNYSEHKYFTGEVRDNAIAFYDTDAQRWSTWTA